MNNNAVVFPTPNDEFMEHIDYLQKTLCDPFADKEKVQNEIDMLLKLTYIRSKANVQEIRMDVTKFLMSEKGSTLGLEVQRMFREYSFIYS